MERRQLTTCKCRQFVSCARCHDHKLDAVSTRDYYALLGVLQSSRQVTHTIDVPHRDGDMRGRLQQLKEQLLDKVGAHWESQAKNFAKHLHVTSTSPTEKTRQQAAQVWEAVLAPPKQGSRPLSDPLYPWTQMFQAAQAGQTPKQFAATWKRLREKYEKESRQRAAFNAKHFQVLGDFCDVAGGRTASGWRVDGAGLQDGAVASGAFTVAPEGTSVVAHVFPAGLFTHSVSEKLNGSLSSPTLGKEYKYLSLFAMGAKVSAVRTVPDNCQLQVRNYRVLNQPQLGWIRVPTLAEHDNVRAYVELVTKFDHPKYPDPLGVDRFAGGGQSQCGGIRLRWTRAEPGSSQLLCC